MRILATVMMLMATPALAQTKAGVDYNFSVSTWQQTVIADTETSVVGIRLLANLRVREKLHVGLRLESNALPGEDLDLKDLDSYNTLEGYVSLYYDALTVRPQEGKRFTIAPAVIAGKQISLRSDIYSDTKTAAGCLRFGWEQSFAYACYGIHEAGNRNIARSGSKALCEASGSPSCDSTGGFGMFRIKIPRMRYLALSGDVSFVAGFRNYRFGPEASVTF